MQADDIKALSDVRLGHALECLDTAQKVMELGDYKCAANRSYYAVFHAMRAVLVYDRIDAKKAQQHYLRVQALVHQDWCI